MEDGARAGRKKPNKAVVCAISAGAIGGLWSVPCQATDAHVENRCFKLSSSAYEELDARVLLLLKSEAGGKKEAGGKNEAGERPLPAVVCTEQGAWVEWAGKRFTILGRAPIADEVLDIVEAELHDPDLSAQATEDSAVAAGEPMLERGGGSAPALPSNVQPADRKAIRPADARGGGLSVAVESELVSSQLGWATGPAFDFGTSVGPILLGGREAFRFTFAERQVAMMDFEASAAYGAPFNPDAWFGLVLRFGAEWMVAYPSGNSGQAAVVPVFSSGLRLGRNYGFAGWWVGTDVRFRPKQLALHSTNSLVASDVSASLSLGIAFVDWSRK